MLADIGERRRPAPDTLKDWGLSHRLAGSGDRAGIAGLVYDALRRRASSAYLMGEDTPRATALGMLVRERALELDVVARLADGTGHSPSFAPYCVAPGTAPGTLISLTPPPLAEGLLA